EGPVSTVLMPSFYALVCLISVPINISALLAFSRRIRPKKPAAIYMLNLASADLLFALLLPFKISYHFSGNNWIFGEALCRVVTAAFYWNMYCSVLLIACISVDRLLAVVYPIDSLAWRRPRNATIACASMWVLSLAGSLPLVLSEQSLYVIHFILHFVFQKETAAGYFLTMGTLGFIVPALVCIVSYALMLKALRKSMTDPTITRMRRKAVALIVIVLVMFLVCFTPSNVMLLVHYSLLLSGSPNTLYGAYVTTLCLASLNSCLDPFLYYFISEDFREHVKNTFLC
uniref:G-protein coupled receptors family 1 profile domain-containing protein n=1 Tax=Tetraodon nigroviridis TaxID=99883 RepID=H3C1T5_TETNG